MDARDRESMLKRERLSTEKAELDRSTANFQDRAAQMQKLLQSKHRYLKSKCSNINLFSKAIPKMKKKRLIGSTKKQNFIKKIAAKRAQLELLSEKETRHSGFPVGTQELLKNEELPSWLSADQLIGPLAEKVEINPKWQDALEASLRSVIDTLIVRDQTTARLIFSKMKSESLEAFDSFMPTSNHLQTRPLTLLTL